jgi:hypothetical protein
MTPAEIFGLVALMALGLIFLFAIRVRLDGLQSRIAAVTRVEAKLDLLLKQANIKFDPFAHVSDDIVEALRANRTIEAIKFTGKQPASASNKRRNSSKRCSGELA